MSQIVHCGKNCSWRQRGNITGHCSGCHRTFDGEKAFDRHQTVTDGRVTCHDPATMVHQGARVGESMYRSRMDDLGVTYWSINPSQAELDRWAATIAERRRRDALADGPDPVVLQDGLMITASDGSPEAPVSGSGGEAA